MIFGIIALIVIVLIVLWGVSAYNGLVTLRNRVKNGWAQIDVQLKQRADSSRISWRPSRGTLPMNRRCSHR